MALISEFYFSIWNIKENENRVEYVLPKHANDAYGGDQYM